MRAGCEAKVRKFPIRPSDSIGGQTDLSVPPIPPVRGSDFRHRESEISRFRAFLRSITTKSTDFAPSLRSRKFSQTERSTRQLRQAKRRTLKSGAVGSPGTGGEPLEGFPAGAMERRRSAWRRTDGERQSLAQEAGRRDVPGDASVARANAPSRDRCRSDRRPETSWRRRWRTRSSHRNGSPECSDC